MENYTENEKTGWEKYVSNNQVTLVIEDGITAIGDYAFNGCTWLKGTLTLPASVTRIGKYAFAGCTGLSGSLALPAGLGEIDEGAFANCTGFADDLVLPAALGTLGKSAFAGCSGFKGTLTIPESLSRISQSAFAGAGFTGDLVLPYNVGEVEASAFEGCACSRVIVKNGACVIADSNTTLPQAGIYGYKGSTAATYAGKYSLKFTEDHCYEETGRVNSTCAQKGTISYQCIICDEKYTDEIALKDHVWSAPVTTKEATCKEDGENTYTCSVCKNTKTEAIPRTENHTWGEWEQTKAPELNTDGEEQRTCSVCSKTETRKISKISEDARYQGCTELKALASAGLSFTMDTDTEIVWQVSDETVARCDNQQKQAASGKNTYSCTVTGLAGGLGIIEACDKANKTVYAIFAVNVDAYSYKACVGTTLEVTFSSAVSEDFTFECESALINPVRKGFTQNGSGYSYTYSLTAAKAYEGNLTINGKITGPIWSGPVSVTEHQWNTVPTVEKQSTCTTPGSQSIHCSLCDAVKEGSETEIPVLDHTWNTEYTVDKAATCKEKGSKSIHCSVCGTVKEGSKEEIPVTAAHKWDTKYTVDKAATCTAKGSQSIYCTVCGARKTDSQMEIAVKAHTWGNWQQTVAPTTKTEGKEQRACSVCKQTETRTVARRALNLTKVQMNKPTVVSGDHIQLTWGPVVGADGYVIYRSTGGSWKSIATLKGNVLTYTDTSTKIGTTYSYSVRAYAATDGETKYSPSNKPGVSVKQTFYGAVSMRSAKAASTKSIKIGWNGRKKATGYVIYRRIPGKSWKKLATVGKVTKYTDKTCKAATTYQYAVKAFTKVGSKYTYSKRETIGVVAVTKMVKPNLTVKSTKKRTATLKWTKQSNVSGYVIYRKEAGGRWEKIKRVSAKTSTYTDKKLTRKKTYYYIVKAYKKAIPSVGLNEPVYSPYSKKKVKVK